MSPRIEASSVDLPLLLEPTTHSTLPCGTVSCECESVAETECVCGEQEVTEEKVEQPQLRSYRRK